MSEGVTDPTRKRDFLCALSMAATRPKRSGFGPGCSPPLALAAIHASPLIADTTWQINTVLLDRPCEVPHSSP